jgi:hypothetical protein
VTQARYQRLGTEPLPAQTWQIPLCLTRGARASCSLLETAAATLPAVEGTGALLPNAGGAGYYRFRLDPAGWDRLVASAATLPGPDALALADSVWADFAAGTGSFARVVATARGLSGHPERLAATHLSGPLEYVGESMLAADQVAAYRRLVSSIYAPRLAALGFDPRLGAHKGDRSRYKRCAKRSCRWSRASRATRPSARASRRPRTNSWMAIPRRSIRRTSPSGSASPCRTAARRS